MRRWLFPALAIVLLLNGCSWIKSWGKDDDDAPAELVEFETTLEVGKVWSTGVGSGLDKAGRQLRPVYSSGTLYAADYKGLLMAIDAGSGRKLWEIKTKLSFTGGPGISGELLLMGTQDGEVLAFDATSGTQLWSATVTSEVLAAPAVADDIVVVRSIDGRVFGLDADTGRRIWVYDHSVPLLSLRGNSPLLLHAGVVFIGYDGGQVVALRQDDGTLIWEQTLVTTEGRTELERLSDIDGQLMFVASDLLVASYKNRLASLAADSGRLLWFKDISSATGVAVNRVNLALSDQDGNLWLVDRRNGAEFWKNDQLLRRGLTRPAIYGSFVVVGDAEGYLHWLNISDGRFAARAKVGGKGFSGPPLVVGNTLYVMTKKGELVAFRAGAALN
ncbi:MAG: outer membrane protein assembly factor BamB [Gammaproteobacteria bacterium]|nr:MAG: outer membrane protein assembly factor BamB [Gammaproteobacteria bacterium]